MRYGVVPSGGLGTRSGLPHSKELATVAGIPVIEYIFDRLVLSDINHIFVTIVSDKSDLVDYLTNVSPHKKLLTLLPGQRKGLLDGIISPASLLKQSDEIFFGLPDTVWYPETCYQTLSMVPGDIVLGLLPSDKPELYGSVTIQNDVATSIIEKPASPTSPWIWSFGKFKVSIVPELIRLGKLHPAFTNILGAYTKKHPIKIVTFKDGIYFDTGTPEGLFTTNQYVKK